MEKRYSKSIFAILCVFLMVAMGFQNVSAGGDSNGKNLDVFIDH